MMHFPLDGSIQRRGVILLVVITLLTLFAVLGLSFVLYANATAEGARLNREAQTENRPEVDPELLFSLFLGQLLYDAPDDQTGVFSALRGHSLARSMFGLNYDRQLLTPDRTAALNAVPYNGTGRMRVPLPLPLLGQDDYYLINYTYFREDQNPFLRDPERPGIRTPNPGAPPDPLRWQPRSFAGGYNAPYTYPDLNNMFLAAVRADGSVLLPSFHRPWAGFGSLDPTNPKWRDPNPMLKYMVLRPRPVDHARDGNNNPLFPLPQDAGGDVKNLIGYPGTLLPNGQYANNDSFWIDLDAPVMTAPDGRKYKALFAPLIMDLDNRVNLNVHGNARGALMAGPRITGRKHASNQGWGPWEVNPGHLGGPIDPSLPLTVKQAEWVNMVTGTNAPAQRGRLSFAGPPYGGAVPPGTLGRPYSPVDLDGVNESTGQASDAPFLPGMMPAKPWQCFPTVSPGYGNGSAHEYRDHPALANPFRSAANHVFPLSNVEALLRYGDTGSPALTSELFRLAPLNFGDRNDPESIRRRNLVTVHSCDVDRPGIVPFFWTVPLAGNNQYLTMGAGHAAPSGARVPFPRLGLASLDPGREADFTWGNPLRPEPRTADHLSLLRRLDLNRPLPPYPAPNPNTGFINPRDLPNFEVAQRARQIFAEEIFERLWRLTGAGRPNILARPAARWDAFRWLAQLAVNIVDFIDADEYITPFQWYPAEFPFYPQPEWVFGTELPRLVINEVYAQTTGGATNFWVELHNPLAADPSLVDGGKALLGNGAGAVYHLCICAPDPGLGGRDNVRGNPSGQLGFPISLCPPNGVHYVLPSNGQYSDPLRGNAGFYVVGHNNLPNLPTSFGLATEAMTRGERPAFSLVLRRLASPHLPHNETNLNLPYNPYVTVDYMKDVTPSDGSTPSRGRSQPYAAEVTAAQEPDPWLGGAPMHSFFQCNVDRSTPRPNLQSPPPDLTGYPSNDWLVHLDRPLISPMELLHVSACKPHELTQKFVVGPNPADKNLHRAPWFDEHIPHLLPNQDLTRSLRLYRVLEFFTTGHLSAGMKEARYPNGSAVLGTPVVGGVNVPMFLPNGLSGHTLSGGTWQIVEGSSVVVGQPGTEETVRVKSLLPNGFIADFLRAHTDPNGVGVPVKPTVVSDRIPGKINLNTVWDLETFLALCDPQPANEFVREEAKGMFEKLREKRTPGWETGVIGADDRPILSMAIGNAPADDRAPVFPNGSGLEDTFFRSTEMIDNVQAPRLMHIIGGNGVNHPYFENQLLHKIGNHLTTRSNVFAVWVTVGFFEVKDDTTRPVKLGQELVLASGSTVRHRMFAVVDRSVMTANPGPQPSFRLSTNPVSTNPANPWTTGLVVPYYSIIQ